MAVTDRGFNPTNNNMIDRIKAKALEFEEIINEIPNGRRKSIALTNLETASMYAVKAAIVGDV